MAASVHGVLDGLRQRTSSECDKGDTVEDLVAKFSLTNPQYSIEQVEGGVR